MAKPTKKLIGVASPIVGTLLGGPIGGLAGTAIGGGLGGMLRRSADQAGASQEVATMPMANDAAATAARRRRMLANQMRSGRQSTLLSATDTLG